MNIPIVSPFYSYVRDSYFLLLFGDRIKVVKLIFKTVTCYSVSLSSSYCFSYKEGFY